MLETLSTSNRQDRGSKEPTYQFSNLLGRGWRNPFSCQMNPVVYQGRVDETSIDEEASSLVNVQVLKYVDLLTYV
jgi:hypothetical protein